MGLQDYTYRLKAMAGDSAPHDELGVSGDLSGGTITLEDRGGGDVAWQVSGGPASVGIPLRSVNQAAAGGGMTIAMTIRMVNYGSVDFAYFIGAGPNAPSSGTDNPGIGFGRTSSGTARARYKAETSTLTWSRATGSDFTVVLTVEMNYSGSSDRMSAQHDATTTTSTATTATASDIDTFWVQGLNSAVIQVKDFVAWGEELSLTDRETLRDNGIRATLDAGDSTPPVLTSPVGTQTGSTTATVGATTDEGNGTLYAVVTTSATAPSAAQIEAGEDHTGAAAAWDGSVAVASPGAKTLNATGLAASTSYYAHLLHVDAAANDSNIVSSAQFTTAAAGGSAALLKLMQTLH